MLSTFFEQLMIKHDHVRLNNLYDCNKVLDVIITDLKTAYKIIHIYLKRMLSDDECPEKSINSQDYLMVMFNYIILTLNKYLELYEKYSGIINESKASDAKMLYKTLKSLQIDLMRNKFSGHAFDDKTKRPLEHQEFLNYIINIEKNRKSLQAFIMEIDVYPFINDKPITLILENIQVKVNEEFDILKKKYKN